MPMFPEEGLDFSYLRTMEIPEQNFRFGMIYDCLFESV